MISKKLTQFKTHGSCLKDLPPTATGVHLTTEEFLEVYAEEPGCSEISTTDIVQLTGNNEGVTDSESEDVDPRAGQKVTSEEAEICV
jgi:hypothetical protein